MSEDALRDFLRVEAVIAAKKPEQLSDDDLRQAESSLRNTIADVVAMQSLEAGTVTVCTAALK